MGTSQVITHEQALARIRELEALCTDLSRANGGLTSLIAAANERIAELATALAAACERIDTLKMALEPFAIAGKDFTPGNDTGALYYEEDDELTPHYYKIWLDNGESSPLTIGHLYAAAKAFDAMPEAPATSAPKPRPVYIIEVEEAVTTPGFFGLNDVYHDGKPIEENIGTDISGKYIFPIVYGNYSHLHGNEVVFYSPKVAGK